MFRLKLLLLFSVFALVLCGCKKEVPKTVTPPEVDAIVVKEGPITEYISAVSSVIAMDSVDLIARVEGYLIKRNFKEGQYVKKGQLLFEIEPEQYTANVKAAEASLEEAKAAQKNATIDYERQKTLVQSDAVSKRAFDEAAAKKMEADAQVKGAEAKLASEKRNLSYTKIYAPFDGQIGLAPVSEGNLVNLSTGTLAEVVKNDTMRIEFVVNEMDILAIQKYRKNKNDDGVKILLYLQDGSLYPQEGKVNFWNNVINPTTGTLKLQAVFDNKDHKLIPGMFSRVKIEPTTPSNKLIIPQLAIMSDQSGDYVYVVDKENTVSRRTIKTGFKDDTNVIVLDNLKAGETIITNGLQKARPGQKVTISKPQATTDAKATSPATTTNKDGATK